MALRDAEDVAKVHVAAWKAAYRGLVPQGYLDQLTAESRVPAWRGVLTRSAPSGGVRVVAEDEYGSVCGFLTSGPADAQASGSGAGEIYVLNVDPAHWGEGHGTALMTEALRNFGLAGFSSAVLWVHPANHRARRFYESRGWRSDGEPREQEVFGVSFPEVRYSRDM